jgi:outer membrane receptor protein involved in Fe transport
MPNGGQNGGQTIAKLSKGTWSGSGCAGADARSSSRIGKARSSGALTGSLARQRIAVRGNRAMRCSNDGRLHRRRRRGQHDGSRQDAAPNVTNTGRWTSSDSAGYVGLVGDRRRRDFPCTVGKRTLTQDQHPCRLIKCLRDRRNAARLLSVRRSTSRSVVPELIPSSGSRGGHRRPPRALDRLTSVNERGVNDPHFDQDESDRPKRLNRDKQEIGEGLDAHEDDAEPASPGRPRDDSKPSRQNNKTHNQVPPAPRGRARTDPVVLWLDVESAPDYQS